MNESEKIAYKYLKKTNENKKIQFFSHNTPDFLIENDRYEVKKAYGNKIIFSPSQLTKMMDEDFIIVVEKKQIKEIFKWKNRQTANYKLSSYEEKAKVIRLSEYNLEKLNSIEGKTYNEKFEKLFNQKNNQITDLTEIENLKKRVATLESNQMSKERVERIVAMEVSNLSKN